MTNDSTAISVRQKLVTHGFIIPFILVTSLFFLWGFAHSLLDVLNKHFQDILGITKARSGWVQAALYGGYAVMAIPAGLIMNRFGYKRGIIFGLLTYAVGAFLFMPAAQIQTFEFTLFCLFVIACGLTCLETAANPFSTVLGPKDTSEQRLNLSQSFNGLGWIMGPAIGGLLILGGDGKDPNKFASMTLPYMIIGTLVLLVAILFMLTKMPEIHEGEFDSHGIRVNTETCLNIPISKMPLSHNSFMLRPRQASIVFLSIMLQRRCHSSAVRRRLIYSPWDLYFSWLAVFQDV